MIGAFSWVLLYYYIVRPWGSVSESSFKRIINTVLCLYVVFLKLVCFTTQQTLTVLFHSSILHQGPEAGQSGHWWKHHWLLSSHIEIVISNSIFSAILSVYKFSYKLSGVASGWSTGMAIYVICKYLYKDTEYSWTGKCLTYLFSPFINLAWSVLDESPNALFVEYGFEWTLVIVMHVQLSGASECSVVLKAASEMFKLGLYKHTE